MIDGNIKREVNKIEFNYEKYETSSFSFFLEEFVMLSTLNYHKPKTTKILPYVHCGTFETRSTTANDHYLFYSNITNLGIYMGMKTPTITWSSPLFQQINYLIVRMLRIHSSLWNNLLNMGKTNKFYSLIQSESFAFLLYIDEF